MPDTHNRTNPKREITSVFLVEKEQTNYEIYYCSSCRMPVIQHKGRVIMEVPGEAPADFPLLSKCRNRDCPRLYLFQGTVKQQGVG